MEFSEPEFWITTIGKYIKRVHLKDFKRNGGKMHRGGDDATLLEGDVNYPLVMKLLTEAEYNGPFTAEVFKTSEYDSMSLEEFLADTAQRVNKIAEMAKQGDIL